MAQILFPMPRGTPEALSTMAACRTILSAICVLIAFVALGLPAPCTAHDIPADVKLLAFVKPEGSTLRVLLRVPLAAMREVDVPTRGPGYLDLARAEPALRAAAELWFRDGLAIHEDGRRLTPPRIAGVRVSLPSDRSFASFDAASAHLAGPPLAADADLYWTQQMMDVMLEYPIASERSRFSIHPKVDRLGSKVLTVLRFLPPGGSERAFQLHGDPGLVHLAPEWHQAALRFTVLGGLHILEGVDHLLFIACLMLPFRRLLPVALIATGFTVAHSITLAAVALGHGPGGLWFAPLVEVLIALSIVWTALENIIGIGMQRRWMVAFIFGLVHGFGFAYALRDSLQFAGEHVALSLAAFNVGVEAGQFVVLVVLLPATAVIARRLPERACRIVVSAFVLHTALHWLQERWTDLMKFPLPALDAADAAGLLRWAAAALVIGSGACWIDGRIRRLLDLDGRPASDLRPGTPSRASDPTLAP